MLLEHVSSNSGIVQGLCFSSLLKLIAPTCGIHSMNKLLPVEWILFSESDCKLPVGKKGGFLHLWVPGIEKERMDIIVGRVLHTHIIQFFQHTR